jgi:hypothetical protein
MFLEQEGLDDGAPETPGPPPPPSGEGAGAPPAAEPLVPAAEIEAMVARRPDPPRADPPPPAPPAKPPVRVEVRSYGDGFYWAGVFFAGVGLGLLVAHAIRKARGRRGT